MKGESKVRFLGQGMPATQPPMNQMTSNFAYMGLLWVTIEFWSHQDHVTSIKTEPVLASKYGWPL